MVLINFVIAALLSAISFLPGMELGTRLFPHGQVIFIDGSYTITENVASAPQTGNIDALLIILKVILPILFFVIALLATVFLFYRWKLKEPLKILMDGANHIIENDLDFKIGVQSTDELGQLCTAFEAMRQTLLKSNRELKNGIQPFQKGNEDAEHFGMGPSDSGKSTLLHIISGLDVPASGQVLYGDTDIHNGNDKELSAFCRQKIGFIFQQFNLLPVLSAHL